MPRSGELPASALDGLGDRPFGIYVHIPFCASRCGYCDFNTYTASELGGGGEQAAYAETAIQEVRQARAVLGPIDLPVETVFFGGGTPTLLPPGDLARILCAVDDEFGLTRRAEVSTESNPESVTSGDLCGLREAGFNRISFGMQSARSHVLSVLDRRHTPGGALEAVRLARAAGFDHVNLDLIYGTPGESDSDWEASLSSALSAAPDHISAYSLIVEEGTRLATRIRRGEIPMPDDDVCADRYLMASSILSAAGFSWYEVSNWASAVAGQCRHNLLYWTGGDWWGIGPGAHSHVGGARWWNVKHPSAYAERLASGVSPAHSREILSAEERRMERIMLELRLSSGCPLSLLPRDRVERLVEDGLLDRTDGRAVLTLRGRLLADAIIRDLA